MVAVVETSGAGEGRVIGAHGPGWFLGELGLITGQAVFVSAGQAVFVSAGQAVFVSAVAHGRLRDFALRNRVHLGAGGGVG